MILISGNNGKFGLLSCLYGSNILIVSTEMNALHLGGVVHNSINVKVRELELTDEGAPTKESLQAMKGDAVEWIRNGPIEKKLVIFYTNMLRFQTPEIESMIYELEILHPGVLFALCIFSTRGSRRSIEGGSFNTGF